MASIAQLSNIETFEQNRKLNRQHLIAAISRNCELPMAEAEQVLEAVLGSIVNSLRRDEHVELRGFGTFITRHRKARLGRNPKTGAEVDVNSKRVARFRASRQLLKLINGEVAD